LKEYAKVVNGWAQLYFVAWYLISVILIINLFVALILEVSSLPFSVAIVS